MPGQKKDKKACHAYSSGDRVLLKTAAGNKHKTLTWTKLCERMYVNYGNISRAGGQPVSARLSRVSVAWNSVSKRQQSAESSSGKAGSRGNRNLYLDTSAATRSPTRKRPTNAPPPAVCPSIGRWNRCRTPAEGRRHQSARRHTWKGRGRKKTSIATTQVHVSPSFLPSFWKNDCAEPPAFAHDHRTHEATCSAFCIDCCDMGTRLCVLCAAAKYTRRHAT